MPPEMHFESPQDLKDAFWSFQLSRVQDELKTEEGMRFLPPANRFEKVKTKSGKYMLLPTALDLSFVFRGQTAFYKRCLPTIYRKDVTNDEILIERLRCIEFENYLKQLPQITDFEQRNYKIDYLGLAQHYGLKTDVIDLTNSIDVALFFAMCNMSEDGRYFFPQKEDKEYIGYIYAIETAESDAKSNRHLPLFDGKLYAIGMQPFYRPGNQRGFGLHLQKGEMLTGLLYSFSYTIRDSEEIYNFFKNGNILWHEDTISQVARELKTNMLFSYETLNCCLKRYVEGGKKEKLSTKHRLIDLGCKFQKKSLWAIDNKKLKRIRDNYELQGGFDGINEIVQRKMMLGGKMHHCLTTDFLAQEQMIRFPISGCAAPIDYPSPYQYTHDKDEIIWGYARRKITTNEQTEPDAITHKVEKWKGNWRDLKIDYNRDKKLKMELVRIPKS